VGWGWVGCYWLWCPFCGWGVTWFYVVNELWAVQILGREWIVGGTDFGPRTEYVQLIQGQLERSQSSSAKDVVGHALQLLENERAYDPLWLEEMREKTAIGLAQIENGQVLDGKTVIEQLRARVRQRGSWKHFQQVWAWFPDVEPEEFDHLQDL
jgi:antitoxin ParD1/3/4